MNKYLRLFRFGNGIMGIVGTLVGAFIAVGLDITDHYVNLAISCLVVLSFMAGGNSLNDYIDIEIDRIGHPDRPLPMGEIRPRTALILGISGMLLAGILSLFTGSLLVTCTLLIAAVMMISYELVLKQRGFVGNLTIAVLTGMIFLFGGAVVDNIEANYIIALMAVLVSIGREITKDIEDMGSDEGRATLPMKIGMRNASILAAIFFIAGPALSIWPLIDQSFGWLYCIVLVADAIFIYTAFIIFRNAKKAQKFAKIAMLIALIAFILGVL